MAQLTTREIQEFLGRHYPHADTLYLLGGSAHRTLDIDYTSAPAQHATQLQAAIETPAAEMRLEPEAMPIEELGPLPDDRAARHKFLGRFGALEVYIYDPYPIALSKIARGFETDLEDVVFLLRQNVINLEQLADYVIAALPEAWDFDIDPVDMQQHLAAVRKLLDV